MIIKREEAIAMTEYETVLDLVELSMLGESDFWSQVKSRLSQGWQPIECGYFSLRNGRDYVTAFALGSLTTLQAVCDELRKIETGDSVVQTLRWVKEVNARNADA